MRFRPPFIHLPLIVSGAYSLRWGLCRKGFTMRSKNLILAVAGVSLLAIPAGALGRPHGGHHGRSSVYGGHGYSPYRAHGYSPYGGYGYATPLYVVGGGHHGHHSSIGHGYYSGGHYSSGHHSSGHHGDD